VTARAAEDVVSPRDNADGDCGSGAGNTKATD
jgi:hypothetical protein